MFENHVIILLATTVCYIQLGARWERTDNIRNICSCQSRDKFRQTGKTKHLV